jgi:hypothetical protein
MASAAAPPQAPADEEARAAATAELVKLFMAVEDECHGCTSVDVETPAGAADLLAALPRLLEAGLADVNVRLDHMTPLLLVRAASQRCVLLRHALPRAQP